MKALMHIAMKLLTKTHVWLAPFGVKNQEIAPPAKATIASMNTRNPDMMRTSGVVGGKKGRQVGELKVDDI
jgi:hypothetical protein